MPNSILSKIEELYVYDWLIFMLIIDQYKKYQYIIFVDNAPSIIDEKNKITGEGRGLQNDTKYI